MPTSTDHARLDLHFIVVAPDRLYFGFHHDFAGSIFNSKDCPRPRACQPDPSWVVAFFSSAEMASVITFNGEDNTSPGHVIARSRDHGRSPREILMQIASSRFLSLRRIRLCGIVLFGILTVWLLVSTIVAYKLTSRARAQFDEAIPQPAWGRVEGHRIKTSDGEEIGAWFVDSHRDTPSVLLLHGNNGSRRNSLSRAEMLVTQGYAVLMISLRAHGDSTGKYHDIGFGARQDVWAAVEFLEAHRTGRPIIIIGTSMGSAAAVFAAGALGHQVAGYILKAPTGI